MLLKLSVATLNLPTVKATEKDFTGLIGKAAEGKTSCRYQILITPFHEVFYLN